MTQSSKQTVSTLILFLEKKGHIKSTWYDTFEFYLMEKPGPCGQRCVPSRLQLPKGSPS